MLLSTIDIYWPWALLIHHTCIIHVPKPININNSFKPFTTRVLLCDYVIFPLFNWWLHCDQSLIFIGPGTWMIHLRYIIPVPGPININRRWHHMVSIVANGLNYHIILYQNILYLEIYYTIRAW